MILSYRHEEILRKWFKLQTQMNAKNYVPNSMQVNTTDTSAELTKDTEHVATAFSESCNNAPQRTVSKQVVPNIPVTRERYTQPFYESYKFAEEIMNHLAISKELVSLEELFAVGKLFSEILSLAYPESAVAYTRLQLFTEHSKEHKDSVEGLCRLEIRVAQGVSQPIVTVLLSKALVDKAPIPYVISVFLHEWVHATLYVNGSSGYGDGDQEFENILRLYGIVTTESGLPPNLTYEKHSYYRCKTCKLPFATENMGSNLSESCAFCGSSNVATIGINSTAKEVYNTGAISLIELESLEIFK